MLVSVLIDATECPIQRSCSTLQHVFYSGKKKQHTIKYEIRVSIQTGLIVWLSGVMSGAVHDLTITKNGILKEHPDRLFIGDKEYYGHENIIIPFKSPQIEAEIQ